MENVRTRRSSAEVGRDPSCDLKPNGPQLDGSRAEMPAVDKIPDKENAGEENTFHNARHHSNGSRRYYTPRAKHGHAYFRSMGSRSYIEDFESEIDPEGDKKINSNGYLTEGREYKVRCFNLPRDPGKLFVLAGDVSRALQFRDTYVLYLKNPNLVRIMATPEDREYMKNESILPAILKNRSASITTARSMFREFGHRCIKGGRIVVDDYWVSDPKDIIRMDPPLQSQKVPSVGKKTPELDPSQLQQSEDQLDSDTQPYHLQFSFTSTPALFSKRKFDKISAQRSDSKIVSVLSINNPKMFRTVASSLTFNKLLLESRRESHIDSQTSCRQYPIKSIKPPYSFPITSFRPPKKEVVSLSTQEIIQNCLYNPMKVSRMFQDKIFNDPLPPDEAFPVAIMPNQCGHSNIS